MYEVDDDRDVTIGFTDGGDPSGGIAVFHDELPPRAHEISGRKLGYFVATKQPGETLAKSLVRLSSWCEQALRIPEGDTLVFGISWAGAIRTYLVRQKPMFDAADVIGADVVAARARGNGRGEGWGVALGLRLDSLHALISAFQRGGRFKIVIQGLVEDGPFELEEITEYDARVVDRACYEYNAFVTVAGRDGADAKSRATSLASALHRPTSTTVHQCENYGREGKKSR